jgi:hypothetical protein
VIGLDWSKERRVAWRLGTHSEHFGDMLFSGRKVNILHGGAIGGGVLRGVSKRLYSFFGHFLNLLLEDVGN